MSFLCLSIISDLKIHYGLDDLPAFRNAVITIGTYDGVHHGHRAILRQVINKAKELNGESILMTFDPHPREVVFPQDQSLRLLTTLSEKEKLVADCGIDHLVVVPFTVEFSQINPYDYTEKIIIEKLGAQHVIIGYDHRFGLNREGNIDLLQAYADKGKFGLTQIPEQEIDDLKVSSTQVRQHLQNGKIKLANRILKHPFVLSGPIKKGLKIASGLGYPTANIDITHPLKLIPKHGTYAVHCILRDQSYDGMLYIGRSTTLHDGSRISAEVNIFHHFDEDFYDETLEIHLLDYIREDQHFDSKGELIANIEWDKVESQNYFINQNLDKQLSIAVLNWNGRQHLEEYLPSLYRSYSEPFDLVVIDNGSTDDSVAWLRENHPIVKIIELDQNYGFAGGYNEGIKQIHTPYIALVNSDIRGTDYWADPLMKRMLADDQIGALQPAIGSDLEKDKYEYAGAAGGYIDALGLPYCRGRIMDTVEPLGTYTDYQECFWATGCAIVLRRDAYQLLGGLDEDFFAHMEEIDLCWRMKRLGYQIGVDPASTVYHLGGGTLDYQSPRKRFLNFRNNWWMMMKNEPTSKLLWLIPVRGVLDSIFGFADLLKGKVTIISVIKGHLAAWRGLSSVRQKRKTMSYLIKRKKARYNASGQSAQWLPLSYMLRGQRTYDKMHRS